jgi:SAM-dependent methyltransferase
MMTSNDDLKPQHFGKYIEQGSYHWRRTRDARWWNRGNRLHARYLLPIRLLKSRLRNSRPVGIDIGCGDGVLLYEVQKRLGGLVVGVDSSFEGLLLAKGELARHSAPAALTRASAFALPMSDASVDYVTAIEIIEHLAQPDTFLREIRRVLKPGGLLICTTPSRRPGQEPDAVRDPFHEHEYIAPELESLMATMFAEVQVMGAYPAWLDELYFFKRGGVAGKAVRRLVRLGAGFPANWFAVAVRERAAESDALLVAIARA